MNLKTETINEEMVSQLIRDQFLMVRYIGRRLEVVNYIVDACKRRAPGIFGNLFIYESARVLYSTIITDLAVLFGARTKSSKKSFFFVREVAVKRVGKSNMKDINEWINSKMSLIESLRSLAKSEIASTFYLKHLTINEDFKGLQIVGNLYFLAVRILQFMCRGEDFRDLDIKQLEKEHEEYLGDLMELL